MRLAFVLALLLAPVARADFTWKTRAFATHAGGLVEAGVSPGALGAGLVSDTEALGGAGAAGDAVYFGAYALHLRAFVGGAAATPSGGPLPVLRLAVDGGASVFFGLGFGFLADELTLTLDTQHPYLAGRFGPGFFVPFEIRGVSLVANAGVAFDVGAHSVGDAAVFGLRGLSDRLSFDVRWRHVTDFGEGFAARIALPVPPLRGRVGVEAAFDPPGGPLVPRTFRGALSYERALGRPPRAAERLSSGHGDV